MSVETLEGRWLLAFSPFTSTEVAAVLAADPAASSNAPVGAMVWDGSRTVAYRDSYLVQMPTAKVMTSAGYYDYQSSAPAVAPGWSVQSVGFGFYSISTPGASTQDVRAWGDAVGAVSVEPNGVLVKQAISTVTPSDKTYGQYLWGLNNTGDPQPTTQPDGTRVVYTSLESRAAAALGNQDNNTPPTNNNFPRTTDADIDAPEAWAVQTGVRDVIVAVFDDGIDDTNPDLNANMWSRDKANLALPAANQIPAFDPNGSLAARNSVGLHGFNSAMYQADPTFYEGSPAYDPGLCSTRPGDVTLKVKKQDANGNFYISWLGANDSHGTHVAGIIGATGNNGAGVTGVNWAVSLYSANIFRYGDYILDPNKDPALHDEVWRAADQGGSMAAFLDAVNRVHILKTQYQQNFVVANLSFNTYDANVPAMQAALQVLQEDGILIVVSAGNGYDPEYLDGVGDAIGTEPYPLNDCWTYPAGFKDQFPNMIVVTASSAEDTLPRFANWGPNVDIAAPGENIWSTVPISARMFQPGDTLWNQGGTATIIPVQYDSHEPIGLPADPAPPTPPSWSVPTDLGLPVETKFAEQPNISRPYMYRQVVNRIQEYASGSATGFDGAYASMSGTSMATAYVSGVGALMAAEFYRWTGAMPTGAYLKQGILSQADNVSTLTYVEGSNNPRYDIQYRPANRGIFYPVYRTGMYETTGAGLPTTTNPDGLKDWTNPDIADKADPEPRTHFVPGNLRLNAYNSVWWIRSNLPASISVIPRVETAENRGVSRLEGDPGDPGNVGGYWQFLYSVAFNAGTGVFAGQTLPTTALQVQVWTQDLVVGANRATAGADYVGISQAAPVVFTIPVQAAGTKSYDIPAASLAINVIPDTLPENNESFYVNFRLIGANAQSIWCKTRVFTDTIIDDDGTNAKPVVSVTPQAVSITEGNGGIRVPTQSFVTLSLDRPAARTVLVPYQVRQGAQAGGVEATEGGDFIGASLTAQILAGQQTVKVPVYIVGDTQKEGNEQLQVVLGTPNIGIKKRYTSISFLTVLDDDAAPPPVPAGPPAVSISGPSAAVLEGDVTTFSIFLRDANSANYTVPAGYAVAVSYALQSGPFTAATPYVPGVGAATIGVDVAGPASRTLVIPAGNFSGSISVATLADRLVEGDERFSVQVTRATLYRVGGTTSQPLAVVGDPAQAVIADAPSVTISGPPTLVNEGTMATFTIGLVDAAKGQAFSVPAGYAVAVYYSVLSGTAKIGSDFSGPTTGNMVIPAASSSGTINVQTLSDNIVESEETFSVQITRAVLYKVGGATTQPLTIAGSAIASATIADTTNKSMSKLRVTLPVPG